MKILLSIVLMLSLFVAAAFANYGSVAYGTAHYGNQRLGAKPLLP